MALEYLREYRTYFHISQSYGLSESSHRYVIQKRLKIAGAWWKPETAEDMLSLRTLRANGDWDRYWSNQKAA